MRSHGKCIAFSDYTKAEKPIDASEIGAFNAPLTSRLDTDDVFDGGSLCIIDYLATANERTCQIPTHIIYVVKRRAISTEEGWACEYYRKAKCVKLVMPGC